MKQTLLEIVSSVLSDMSSTEVNSIADSVEAQQVVEIAKQTYFNFLAKYDIREQSNIFQLTASGDTSKPTHMSIPAEIDNITWLAYNVSEDTDETTYKEMIYLTPIEFMKKSNSLKLSDASVDEVTDYSGVPLKIRTDSMPTYYTSFDNVNVVFDSYNLDVDSTLQQSKTQCYGVQRISWSSTDTFVPNLEPSLFQEYLAAVKNYCFENIRQMPSPTMRDIERKLSVFNKQRANKLQRAPLMPDYGRN